MQYRNKIIALFMTVCLLVTSLCVPVSAASSSGTMLYNGVELPDIESVWPDKDTYRYAFIYYSKATGKYHVRFLDGSAYVDANSTLTPDTYPTKVVGYSCKTANGSWSKEIEYTCSTRGIISFSTTTLKWANWAVLNWNGNIYFAASDPVDPNAPAVPDVPDSTVTNATLAIETVHAGDDFMSSSVSVSDLESTEAVYSFRANISTGGEVISTIGSDVFSGPFMYWHITKSGLSPETEYTLDCVLLEDGAETSVTVSQTFTTLAAEDAPPVDETETLSLLSAILSAIREQADTQEKDNLTIISWFEMSWLRLRHIEQNAADILAYIKDLVPSKEESALKTATAETTKAVADTVFAEDAPTKVTASDVKDVASSGKEVINAFDTGTSVGDFFAVFSDYTFTGWFSEETRSNLDSVNSVSTFGVHDDPYNHDSYTKNMEALDKFLERSGQVND